MTMVAVILAILAIALAAAAFVQERRSSAKLKRRVRRAEARAWNNQNELLRARARLCERELLDALRANNRPAPDRRVAFKAQWGEDAYLWWLFDRKLDGTFVEAGALDGTSLSCTYALACAGWKGLLVEPVPGPAKACREARPESTVIEKALVAPEGPKTVRITEVIDDTEPARSALSAIGLDEERLAHIRKHGYQARDIDVPACTLDEALDEAGIESPDAVILDLEGLELEVLKGFDLARRRPAVLIVEANTGNDDDLTACHPESLREVRAAVEPHGFVFVDILTYSAVFIAKERTDLIESARSMAPW